MEVVFNHFPQIGSQLYDALGKVVRKTAFDIRAAAANNAPVDTGFLRNSIYFKTVSESSYGAGGGAPTKDAYLLPEVKTPSDSMTAYAAVGANYAAYVNYGHHTRSGSYVPAQPFWEPAIDAVQPSFEAALGAIESQLGGN